MASGSTELQRSIDMLRIWVSQDFPEDAEAILSLCLSDDESAPLGFTHFPVAQKSAGLEGLSGQVAQDLHCGYVYLVSYYFCVDAVLDGHGRASQVDLESQCIVPYLGHLLAASIARVSSALERTNPGLIPFFRSRLVQILSENVRALRSETNFMKTPLVPNVLEEFDNIVGRANPFYLLFELVWRMANHTMTDELAQQLRRFTFVMQLRDDLGDWREDFRAGRWTSFLRECFCALQKIPDEEALEDHIFFSGAYEKRAAFLIKEFDSIVSELELLAGQGSTASWVSAERHRAYCNLRYFVGEKLTFGVQYA